MSIFAGKTLMITGGTGSFGNAVLNRFLRTDIGEIRIFSRDEKKQDDMRHEYQVKYPDVAHKIKVTAMDMVRPKVKEKTSNFEINMKKTLKKDDLFCIFIAYKPSIKIQ